MIELSQLLMLSFDVAPRSSVQPIFDEMYDFREGRFGSGGRPDCQRLALLYIIFAVGALHSLELPANDPSAEEYLDLSKRSLAKTDFLTHSTVAAVQTLVRIVPLCSQISPDQFSI